MAKYAMAAPIPREWSASAAAAIEQNFERIFSLSAKFGTQADTGPVDLSDPDQVTGQLPLANIVNFSVTKRVWGRNSAGAGVAEEVSFTQFLDWVGSATWGDILFRGTAGWQRLPASAVVGYFLQSAGVGADPVYAPITTAVLPIANASHIDYTPHIDGSFESSRAQAGSFTGTINGVYPVAGSADPRGQYIQLGTSAATNSTAAFISHTNALQQTKELCFAWDFDVSFVILTDASLLTNIRYMIGVGVNNESTDPVSANTIAFRFSTAAADPGWVGVTYDGAQSVTALVKAITVNTRYVLRIRKVSGTVFFSVNGGAEVSTSTNVPTNNAYASLVGRVTTLSNAVKSLWLSRCWADYGT